MKILLVDDNAADRELTLRLLRQQERFALDLREAETVAGAIATLVEYDPDCVFLDYRLPDGDAFDFLKEVSASSGSVPFPVILMTGLADEDVAMHAVEAGAQDFLEKGCFDGTILVRVVRHAVDRHRMLAELRIAHGRAQQLATHCPLTGLPNRFLFQDRLATALAAAARGPGHLGILFLDVDRFKIINDSLGHAAGDAVLRSIGERLGKATRNSDTIARVGGDEFILLLPGLTRSEDAGRVATKILDALCAPMLVKGIELRVSASVGIAMFPGDGDHADALLQRADAAMYRAKNEGGGTFGYYTEDMNRFSAIRLSLERDLRLALDNDELVLHFQPQVDGRNATIVGAEALLRWIHPKQGPISPGQFIPLAEETGLIVDLGNWVLREACRRKSDWQRAGLRDVPVSVNASLLQFKRGDFAKVVSTVLAETGLEGRQLEIEVTESCFMRDVEGVSEVLRALRGMGVRIAVDDFGTGYSSLHMLKHLPIDRLKIDRSFVEEAPLDRSAGVIATTIIALANGLGIAVMAEGVERPDQLAFLLEHGCNQSQGFLFSPALPDANFRDILRAGRIALKD